MALQGRNHASKVGGPRFKRQKLGVQNGRSPKLRARSSRDLRAKPQIKGKAEKKKRGEGSGEGARWAPPQNFLGILNFKSFNLVYSWKVNLEIIHFIAM